MKIFINILWKANFLVHIRIITQGMTKRGIIKSAAVAVNIRIKRGSWRGMIETL